MPNYIEILAVGMICTNAALVIIVLRVQILFHRIERLESQVNYSLPMHRHLADGTATASTGGKR